MFVFDAHTHIGKKTIIASAADLVASMNVAGINKALVFAGKMNGQANEQLLEDIKSFPNVLYGIGSVSISQMGYYRGFDGEICPNVDANRILDNLDKSLEEKQIYGLKFYIGYEHYYCHYEGVRPYLELLVKHNKPAIFHSGDCFNGVRHAKLKYAHPLHFDELAVDMPDLKIIIAHLGYPWVIDAAEVCYKNKNVFCDTSGFTYGEFTGEDVYNYGKSVDDFIRVSGGTDKLIFGTDWPISDQRSYVSVSTPVFRYIKPSELENIMGKRALELFGVE